MHYCPNLCIPGDRTKKRGYMYPVYPVAAAPMVGHQLILRSKDQRSMSHGQKYKKVIDWIKWPA